MATKRTLTDVCQNSRCNRPFAVDGIGRVRRFCCDACRQQAHRDAKRSPGERKRKRKVEIEIDAFERLIVDVWLVDPSAAAVMLEFAYNRLMPINNLWIESQVERQRDQANADQVMLANFLDAIAKPLPVS